MSTPVTTPTSKAKAKALASSDAVEQSAVVEPVVEAAPAAPAADTPPALEVLMTKDGASTLVRNNASVGVMQALGWTLA